MLKIQVLGKGLIPRGFGLAPRKEPFSADLTLITTILNTNGLMVNYVNPSDGRLLPLNRQNVKKVWDKYNNWTVTSPAPADTTRPYTPADNPAPVIHEVVMTNPPVTEETKVEVVPSLEKKDEVPPEDPKTEVPESVTETTEGADDVKSSEETAPADEPATTEEAPILRPVNAPEPNNRNSGNNNKGKNHNHR